MGVYTNVLIEAEFDEGKFKKTREYAIKLAEGTSYSGLNWENSKLVLFFNCKYLTKPTGKILQLAYEICKALGFDNFVLGTDESFTRINKIDDIFKKDKGIVESYKVASIEVFAFGKEKLKKYNPKVSAEYVIEDEKNVNGLKVLFVAWDEKGHQKRKLMSRINDYSENLRKEYSDKTFKILTASLGEMLKYHSGDDTKYFICKTMIPLLAELKDKRVHEFSVKETMRRLTRVISKEDLLRLGKIRQDNLSDDLASVFCMLLGFIKENRKLMNTLIMQIKEQSGENGAGFAYLCLKNTEGMEEYAEHLK